MDHGRSRDSIADIEEQLTELFAAMPSTTLDENGDPVIPHADLPAMLAEYTKRHGTQLLSPDGEVAVQDFLETHRDYKVTPAFMLHLIAMMTPSKAASNENPAPQSADDNSADPRADSDGASSPDADFRGRGEGSPNHSVSLSRQSSNSSFHGPGAPSTPLSSGRVASSSPFDSTARRRSTPLSSAAPSAWTRKPLPASRRRKSDAGSASGNRSSSDNETTPAIARGPRRSRAPSNPVSPSQDSFPPTAFPTSRSAPLHSPDNSLINASKRSHSFDQSIGMSQTLVDPDFSYAKSKRTPALKFHSSGSDSDTDREQSEDEDSTHRYARQALSSDASLAPQDLLEALQKSHAELARKAADSEKRMQNRLAERETEIAELEAQLDDLKTELSASRREEKELRVKERANMAQFATFESEILKLTKNLEHSRTQYSSMQKQYQEQCAETERMRNLLRRKEQELKEADDRGFAHEGEVQKWSREREALENSIETLEAELSITRQAVNELDEQKQENLLLKETIDRMRFDLDALRAGMGPSSAQEGQGTLSRSLANEIRAGFERREREREEAQDEEEVEGVVVEHHDGEGSDDGYIETTITTSRKRVGTRKPIPRLDDGNLREYVDVSTQHEESEFLTATGIQCQQSISEFGTQHQPSEFTHAAEVQTDAKVLRNAEILTERPSLQDIAIETERPRVQDMSIETEVREVKHVESSTETPEVREAQTETRSGVERSVGPDGVQGVETGVGTEAPHTTYAEIGTEAETTPEMCEAEIQTDPEPIQSSRTPVPTAVIDVVPGPSDLPPPYPHAAESGVLKRWHARRAHHGPGSVHAREEWAALKRLIGVDCQVIERAIEGQDVENMVEDKDDEHVETPPSRARKLFRVSFEFTSWPYLLTHAVMGFGVWSLAAAVVVNQLVPQTPTYSDRMNWSAYNNYAGALGEGLVGRGGDSALWSMVERLVLGAAVRVGPGMPT